jgi:NitT/TauT family transport system substrate-binding protein
MHDSTRHSQRRLTLSFPAARLLLAITALALLGSCRPAHEPPLRVGLIVWPGHEPMFLARSRGHLQDQAIQLVELPSTVEVVRAYRSRAIDVAGLTADEVVSIAAVEPEQHRIILVLDISHGADMILARPEFSSMAELRGRRIGFEPDALGAFILARALELSKLSVADVTPVPLSLVDQQRAFEEARVDAVVTFEPHGAPLIARGARKVFDTTQMPGEVLDVLVARRDAVGERRKTLAALIESWFKALAYLEQSPQEAAAHVAARQGRSAREFLQSLEGMRFPDVAENRRMLGGGPDNLDAALRRLSAAMVRARLLERPIEPATLLEDELLPEQ